MELIIFTIPTPGLLRGALMHPRTVSVSRAGMSEHCVRFSAPMLHAFFVFFGWLHMFFFRSRSAPQHFWMLPANVALAIYVMTGAADIPSSSRTSAASGEESVAAPAPGPAPMLSPTSESGDTTEPAMEEPSATASPLPAEPAPDAPEVVATGGESGSASPPPPPEAWGEVMSFLDRPQQARQSALASLPTSDLIRLTLEASATALGRLGWYEGRSSGGDPIRNPPPHRLLLRAAPAVKEPPPRAPHQVAEIKDEAPDVAPAPPPEDSTATPLAVPKVCPLPYPGGSAGPAGSGAGPVPGRPGSSNDPALTQWPARPRALNPLRQTLRLRLPVPSPRSSLTTPTIPCGNRPGTAS